MLGIGALEQEPGHLQVMQGCNEQGIAHMATDSPNSIAVSAFRRDFFRRAGSRQYDHRGGNRHGEPYSAAAAAGDIYASRQPDPVLQQIEQYHDLSISTNDCFRPVSRYWDRINRPEQLMSAMLNAMRTLTDPQIPVR